MIELNNVTKNFGDITAVNSVSFSVNKNSITGLIGTNGAGKSTIIKMLTSQIAPDFGTIKINGFDIVEDSLLTKKQIGYIPEIPNFNEKMTVEYFLNYCADIFFIDKEMVKSIMKIFALDNYSRKKIGTLSKGYKQRLAFAQCLLHNPEVFILDEPLTGLDPSQSLELIENIKNFSKNKTVLFSSHIVTEIEKICDKVIILNKGKIVTTGSIQELKNKYKLNSFENIFINLLKNGQ